MFRFEPKGRKKIDVPVQRQAGGVFPYLREGQPSCSVQAFSGLDEARHTEEDNLFHSVYCLEC